ncbi:putative DBINO protein [Hordeum vulgare]|nr:putative DBINO protein [Hordeum vulgare]
MDGTRMLVCPWPACRWHNVKPTPPLLTPFPPPSPQTLPLPAVSLSLPSSMADAHPNSGGPTIDQPGMAKKKKAKASRKPREECTPEEIVKLDAESAKRRNRRAVVKDNVAARKFTA